ncbi:hypothetical protein TL16_g05442 [Triparma laevis f. inornata]|uniref:Uncharacterized protein n=2 Tax=Triparma laevis TaxID=1534972 RepID=A0A9W7EKY2_9STRA|nr:hypothetical protein TL16_g05442 [Triparma laevis f. inornata]GMH80803.1 hypothetical protein TrLO_g8644 [Triparma laevis f. longispina]
MWRLVALLLLVTSTGSFILLPPRLAAVGRSRNALIQRFWPGPGGAGSELFEGVQGGEERDERGVGGEGGRGEDECNDEGNADADEGNSDLDPADSNSASPSCSGKAKFVDDGTRQGPETLTDRFKYSVNALMGNYDPVDGEDSEEAVADSFAIADALVKEKGGWPALFDFVAVGSGAEGEFESNCIAAVKAVIPAGASFTHETKPVGSKFTRISFSRKVEDAKTLSSIYAALEKVPDIKFKY